MKSNIKIIVFLLVILSSCVLSPRMSMAQQSDVSFQLFYDQLSPYGQWVNYSDYGYVWIPNSGNDFVPYSTNGHWVMTNYGWTWTSDYNWGWAAFHYGRWSFNDSLGWFWVPDNEWGPAWVNWRQTEGYYGWSPMEPGMTISMSFGSRYDSNYDHWMFVRDQDFDRTDVNHYYVNSSEHDRIVRNSVVINNTYIDNSRNTTYVTGPSRNDIQKATGRKIVSMTIQDNNRPGKEISNGRLQIYRPQIDKNNNERKPIPTRVSNQNEVKQSPARDASNSLQTVNPGNMQEKPTNRIIQENNNTRPIQPGNSNNQQNRPTTPTNQDSRTPSVEPSRATPADNNRQVRQPNVVTPQNNTQPAQPRNVNQQDNRQEQRNTPPANVENNQQSVQPQQVNPTNDRKPEQQKSVKQQIKKEQEKIPDTNQERK